MTLPRIPARQLPAPRSDTAGPSAGPEETPPARTAGGAAPAPSRCATAPGLPAPSSPGRPPCGDGACGRAGHRAPCAGRVAGHIPSGSLSWLTPQPLHGLQTGGSPPSLQGPGSCLLCEPRNPRNNLPISEGTNECDPGEKPDAFSSDITSGGRGEKNPKPQEKAANWMSVSYQVWGKSELQTHSDRSLSHIPMGSRSPQPTGTGGRQKCSQLSTQPPFWRSVLRERLLLGN